MANKKRLRLTLRIKLITVLITLSVVPILVIAYSTLRSTEDFVRKNRIHALEGIADLKSQAINAFIEEIGIEFESPAIDIIKPELKYILVRINDDYKIVTKHDTLKIKIPSRHSQRMYGYA